MIKQRYLGRPSSLSLYKSNSQQMKKLFNSSKVPNLTPINQMKNPIPRLTRTGGSVLKPSNDQSTPLSDVNLPTKSFLRMNSVFNFSPLLMIDIQTLPTIESPDFNNILRQKIDACSHLCPFYNEEKENQAIEAKTQHLVEIHRLFIGASPQSNHLSDEQFELIYNMVMKNIVRRLPTLDPMVLFNDDIAPLTEPSWPHLTYAYQILTKLLLEFPEAPFFTFESIIKLLRVVHSSDSRERSQLTQFLLRIVEFRPEFRDQMIVKFVAIVAEHADSGSKPFGISTVLAVFLGILRMSEEMEPLFIHIFRNTLVPLLGDRYFSYFEPNLLGIIDYFVDDDPRNSTIVVNTILKKWPFTKLSKQSTFLSTLARSIPKMGQKDLSPIIQRLFTLFANGTDSECLKVAEAAFSMWTTIGFERVIADNIKYALPILLPHVMRALRAHWSQTIRENASFALNMMNKFDSKQVQAYNNSSTYRTNDSIQENPQLKKWVAVARSASIMDSSLNLSKKLLDITAAFGSSRGTGSPIFQSTIRSAPRARSNSFGQAPITRPALS